MRWAPVCTKVVVALLLFAPPARAQLQQGQILGTVTAKETKKPLAGVTVVVSGPALQSEQTEFTDAAGRYLITQLPSGDGYVVRFYFNDVVVERPGVRVGVGKTLTVSLEMPMARAAHKAHVIRERAPNIDSAGTGVTTEVTQEILENTAVRGRSYESALTLAPGTLDLPRGAGGDVGISISGSTGNENLFVIDGLNTTDPNQGLLGTPLHHAFIKEISVLSGGYQAEYGRSTGGVVSVVTRGGSNEFHGSAFFSFVPFQLEPRTVSRLGEALGARRRLSGQQDVGFELGGPLLKDRIWFYVGFAPTFTQYRTDRLLRTQSFDPATGRAQVDGDFACPGYLALSSYCDGPRTLALRTTEVGERTQELPERGQLYNMLGKLQFNLSPNHNLTLGYNGAVNTYSGHVGFGGFFGASAPAVLQDLSTSRVDHEDQVHDLTLRYSGKLLGHKLQIEAMYGLHYQDNLDNPPAADQQLINYRASATDPYSLADFEDLKECRRSQQAGPTGSVTFNPCPLTSYARNGYGFYIQQRMQRHVTLASLAYFARFLGTHALKAGLDFEAILSDRFRANTGPDYDPRDPLSGHRVYNTGADGTGLSTGPELGTRDASGMPLHINGLRSLTQTRNFAVYLRDNWNVGFVPGLTLNLGLRWEAQEIYGNDGSKQIAIYDNWAPRVGAVYDWTRKGRSKLYVHYGRYYESIPTNLSDRQFSGEGGFGSPVSTTCPQAALQPGGRPVPVPGAACNFEPSFFGGTYGQIAPGLQGQFINEVVAGIQYDVGLDVVLGVAYIHRDLGNIIEDMSTNGGQFYFVGNPGAAADPGRVSELEQQLGDLRRQAMASPQNGQLQVDLQNATFRLESYKANALVFPKARRDHDAVQFTVSKRLSSRFGLLASYTYSRTLGNYPGLFQATNGQLDANMSSAWDLPDLLANRNGPLPNDRPHNVKFTGYYVLPIGEKSSLTGSLTFTAFSGRPIEVLGMHLYYGPEAFILPRGSGGRTPTVTQFDVHVGYEHRFTSQLRLSLTLDIINLLNQREVTNVDDLYTGSVVGPLLNGKPEDLVRLKATDGTLPVPNSNYGQPTAYQAPMYMRLGGRMSF